MQNRKNKIFGLLATMLFCQFTSWAQQPLGLQQAIDSALEKNHLLAIKRLQVQEKAAKVVEDKIKYYPVVTVGANYTYNFNVGEISIPQGAFGALPTSGGTILLPNQTLNYPLNDHNIFTGSVMLYQPISQQWKINTGVQVGKNELKIAEIEQEKAIETLSQAVEKLYYGLLIVQKQQEESNAKLQVAKLKLYDVESALASGKTIDVNKAGLQASMADEEQNLLKLQFQADDYLAELKHLTGLQGDNYQLEDVLAIQDKSYSLNEYITSADSSNSDIQIATLTQEKTELAIQAAKQSYIPDFGAMAGYVYQKGFDALPQNNPFVGLSLKWNLQDIFSNKQVMNQRAFLLEQSKENLANTQEQVRTDIEKAYRKLKQSAALIDVAQKAVEYRKEEVKIETDKRAAGLNKEADLLEAKAKLAKSEADLYAAQLSYKIALSDLKNLSEIK